MLLAGIIGHDGRTQIASLISSILSSRGIKVSIIDSSNLAELDYQRIRSYLRELEKNSTEVLIMKTDIWDVNKDFFNNLHFDIMIYTNKAENLNEINMARREQMMRKIFSLLDEKGIAIVNIDDCDINEFLQGMSNYIVTYGFNPKASITASSIGDTVFKEGFICCQQKVISAKNGMLIEPQEYRIDMKAGEFDVNSVLAAVTFAIVNGVDLNTRGCAGVKS